jgi:hypothetical protein
LDESGKQVLPGNQGWGGERGIRGSGRNDPDNVCTYEYVNKEKK